jgi:hypothetical protein
MAVVEGLLVSQVYEVAAALREPRQHKCTVADHTYAMFNARWRPRTQLADAPHM